MRKVFDSKATTDLVKEQLDHDLYLLEMLKEGLVNYSALARKLLPTIKKANPKATTESISIAAKRYVERQSSLPSVQVRRIIAGSQLTTKSDVVHLTFKRNHAILSTVLNVSKNIDWDREEMLFINQGFGEVTLIVDKTNENLFKVCKQYLIERTDELALLSVKETFQQSVEKSIEVPGLYAYFMNLLSRRSINIIEIVSTYSQLTFVLSKKDLLTAYQVLDETITYFRTAIKEQKSVQIP